MFLFFRWGLMRRCAVFKLVTFDEIVSAAPGFGSRVICFALERTPPFAQFAGGMGHPVDISMIWRAVIVVSGLERFLTFFRAGCKYSPDP